MVDIRPWLTFSEETSTDPSEGDTTEAVSSSPLKSSFFFLGGGWGGEGVSGFGRVQREVR